MHRLANMKGVKTFKKVREDSECKSLEKVYEIKRLYQKKRVW